MLAEDLSNFKIYFGNSEPITTVYADFTAIIVYPG